MKKLLLIFFLLAIPVLLFFLTTQVVLPLLKPSTGRLSVSVPNQKAKIYLDGTLIGTSPFLASNLRVGEHVLEIEREDGKGERFKTSTTLSSTSLSLINLDLSPGQLFTSGENLYFRSGATGITLSTRPTETQVTIDSEDAVKSPVERGLEPGVHTITVKKPGYLTREVNVNIEEGFKLNALVSLAANPFEKSTKIESGERTTIFSLSNPELELEKDIEGWVEGIKHIQASFTGAQTRFDAAIDSKGKVYTFNQTEWDNKIKAGTAINVAYLGSKNQESLTAAAARAWQEIKNLFNK